MGLRGPHSLRRTPWRPRSNVWKSHVKSAATGGSVGTDAARQRRHREREKNGRLVVLVEVDAAEVIELLVEARLLDARADFHDRADIAAGIARFLSLSRHA